MKQQCAKCGGEFERDIPAGFEKFQVFKTCDACINWNAAKRREELDKQKQIGHETQWMSFCPPAFQDTDISKLPFPSVSMKVMAWEYGKRGIIFHGKTRSGKTRTAWLLVKKHFEAGRTARVMDSMSGFEYAAIFTAGGQAALEWVEDRAKCSLLFLDDVFKVKLTESFEAAMFAIVDYRFNNNLPIIVTLNDTGQTLSARMTNDRGDAFIARLKEMCETVHFK